MFYEEGPLVDELREAGMTATVIEAGRFRDPLQSLKMLRATTAVVRQSRPDLVFGWMTRAHVYLGAGARLAGVPRDRIIWFQHHTPDGDPIETLAACVPAARVIVASQTVAAAQARVRPHRSTMLSPYGIAEPDVVAVEDVAALRASLGISPQTSVIGLPGRLVRWKGQDRFLDAIARLLAEGRDVHGLIVGGSGHGLDVDFEPELRARAARRDLDGHVTFTGQQPRVVPYLQAMDVLVNASEGEPFGLTIVEAQTIGVPAVAVGIGGPTESIAHGQSGWLVPSGSAADLAAGVGAVLDDPALRERLITGGRKSARRHEANVAVGGLAAQLRQIYDDAERLARRSGEGRRPAR